ncbi:MAG: hypothetical protein ACKOOC_10560 [Cyanobium sp.]
MSFDARSKERLEALGRSLPKKLPLPDASQNAFASTAGTSGAALNPRESRHRLEQEQDPAELFRVLMKTSPDGTVPPHLLERLRELEASPPSASAQALANLPGRSPKGAGAKPKARPSSQSGRATGVGQEERDLYSAFAELLLDDDDA